MPPITAAATDGSRNVSASVTLATLVRPGEEEAGDRREHGREHVQDDRTCHARAPDSRAAIGLSPMAYSSRPKPVRRSPRRISAATGTKTSRLTGRTVSELLGAEPAELGRHAGPGLDRR